MIPGPVQFLFSENINIYLQNLGNPSIDIFFKVITNAGSEQAYIFLASLIFWCCNKNIGIRTMYIILFSAMAAILAKNIFGLPRPPVYLHKVQESDFGFPSGHALVSSGFWGYLGGKTKNRFVAFGGAAAIFLISVSRIYLGVHYAGDVIGGIFVGLLAAFLYLKLEPMINRLGSVRISQYLIAVAVIFVLTATIQRSLVREQMEIGIVMASISVGYIIEEEHIGLADPKNNKQRIKRAIVGVFLLTVIYSISYLLFSDNIFFKYPSLGLTTTLLAPWVFTGMESGSREQC
ncbi:MAG TPA: phosphatase PAP2 family protein [Candidatus Methanoperedens sp.]